MDWSISPAVGRTQSPRHLVAIGLKAAWLQGAALYILCFVVFSALLLPVPGFAGNDDYYHARISDEIIVQGRLRVDFPWLPQTILNNEAFVDHHLLFHMYVAPWVHWGGETGAKLATVSIAAGVVMAAWALLRQIGVRRPWLWALGIFALSAPFLYRLLMVRTQGAALLLVIIALMLLIARRDRWLIPLAFAYAWLYNGFVFIFGVAALYALAAWIGERRFAWQPVIYTGVGLVLGLIINPYFPANLAFITDHLGAKVDFEGGVRVGSEWYPYSTALLLINAGGALAALTLGVLRPSFQAKRRDTVETALLLIALMTLFMLLRSRRFIEYFPAFALLFCAAAWGRGGVAFARWLPVRWALRLLPLLAALALVAGMFVTLRAAQAQIRDSADGTYMAGAARWLAENSTPGALVFQTDWDDFPYLYYYNTANTYLVGLDPTYLQLANPLAWDNWVAITQGDVEQPSALIRRQFGAAYVVSDTRHGDFIEQASADPGLLLVYRDDHAFVWQLTAP